MASIVWWIIALAVLAALAAIGAVMAKAYLSGTSPSAVFFKPRPEPRLGVIEYTNVDSKRKLILIRRDDVEHLIMTGGPVDVVIETGIGTTARKGLELAPPAATVFTRPARTLGTALQVADSDESEVVIRR